MLWKEAFSALAVACALMRSWSMCAPTGICAQTYDRDLADVFAIQSEIAKTIADQLEAKLSPAEKDAIERAPTSDITAFDLYTLAKNLCLTAFGSSTTKANLLQAADLLNQAVARDPSFLQAYCLLASLMTALISSASTILRRASPKRNRRSKRRLVSKRTLGKRTSRAPKIFIGDISITMALWLNWKLPRRACPMMRE